MSCITELLKIKGDAPALPINGHVVIEGGGIYKNHEYLITFTHLGHRCGYVAIADCEVKYVDGIKCHGGVTFDGRDHAAKNLLDISCNDFWVGFDAAHFGDKGCAETAIKYFPDSNKAATFAVDDEFSTHKTYEYMEGECKSIIDQLTEKAL